LILIITGEFHLGGLRTALYNYILARSLKGKYILRIEDTDMKRNVPGSMEKILKSLQWLGIKYDEGPVIGGAFGPYIQSQRQIYYDDAVTKLLAENNAYR